MMTSLLQLARKPIGLMRRAASIRRQAHAIFEWSNEDNDRLEFYKQLIGPTDLIFDIGANIGNRTKVFLRLGARVVAVEPQSFCADVLEHAFGNHPRLTIVRKALGAIAGQAEMMIADAHTVSSLSTEWVSATQKSGRFANRAWNRRELVDMTTMDDLVREFGKPGFVKIDVEGYEYEVLKGLNQSLPLIALEYTPEYSQNTFRCFKHLTEVAGNSEILFQYATGEETRFVFKNWVAFSEINDLLSSLSKNDSSDFGDIYICVKPHTDL